MFVLAFIPMLLVAFAYKELAQDTPDCGTTFTWGTKAFGPWIGWIGGWGLAVSAIIVLANVAEVAAIYLFQFLGLDDAGRERVAKVLLGSFFIIAMTLVSARGIVLSERIQNVLIAIQFGVLIIVSIIALVRVFAGTAGAQAITPQLSWLWPGGLDASLDRGGDHPVHLHLLGLGHLPGRRRGNQEPGYAPRASRPSSPR